MKHLIVLVFALMFAGLGVHLILANIHAPTMSVLITGVVFLLLAMALAIPANLREAITIIMPIADKAKGVIKPGGDNVA